jgi:hypothetical protein
LRVISPAHHQWDSHAIYDFLFDNDYAPWFCNEAKRPLQPRALKEFMMQLHTGETQYEKTKNWTPQQRTKLGQNYLRDLAEDILSVFDNMGTYQKQRIETSITELKRSLELDGYIYRDGKLLASESDVLDAQEEQGVLEGLYASMRLDNLDMFRSHLKLSEEAYIAARWGDAIHNSRLVFEGVLREVAAAHSSRCKGTALSSNTYSKPVDVRQYLEREGLLEPKEREVIQHTYGLLSNTGSHPYMAEKDQARLLRHMALTLSQFVLLRLEGALKQTR